MVTCTADCTCHHLTKNVDFLSEMWNLKQIRILAIANVVRFAWLNDILLSWGKNTTAWLYVTLTGHITIRHNLEKVKAWEANQSIWYSYSTFFSLNNCYQPDDVVFLLQRTLVGPGNSADQFDLVVTCTADCTYHHLTKSIYFLNEMWNLKQIRELVERVSSANQINLVVTCSADWTCHHLTKSIYFSSKMWNI